MTEPSYEDFHQVIFKYIFFLINGANSIHMLNLEPPLWRNRLTCWSQHFVSMLALMWVLNVNATYLHLTLSCSMFGITFLFSGLLVSFSVVGKKYTPLGKLKLTKWRITRNIWSHYGSTCVLWYLLFVQKDPLRPNLRHQVTANIGFFLWTIVFGNRAKLIYDVHPSIDVMKSGIIPILCFCYVAFNVVLYWIISKE